MEKNKYEQDYTTKEGNGMTWLLVGLGVVVVIVLGWWLMSGPSTPTTPEPIATTTPITTTPVASSTATTTQTKPAVKPLTDTQTNAAWKAFTAKCTVAHVSSSTPVLSFRNEGMTVQDNGAAAYKCKDGHTYIY